MAADFKEIMKLVLFGIFALLGLSAVATQIFGLEPINGGPLIFYLTIGGAILLVYNLATKKDFAFNKTEIFALILSVAIISAILFYLPSNQFAWFSVVKQNTMSVLGMP